jgi:hypothetical protein
LEIFKHCLEMRIDLQPEWLPREENEFADYLSKIRDVDDFGLVPSAFSYIQSLYGPFSVDRFASSHNAKLPRFDSFCWCPGASACNTFSQDWGGDQISYCFSPPHLVARTLQHALACRARIVLIALGWRSAWWWPLVCGSAESGLGFATFVRRHLYFPASRAVLVPGLASFDRFCGTGVPLCDVFASDIDFSPSKFFHPSSSSLFFFFQLLISPFNFDLQKSSNMATGT